VRAPGLELVGEQIGQCRHPHARIGHEAAAYRRAASAHAKNAEPHGRIRLAAAH
jgi:hypothetical protein